MFPFLFDESVTQRGNQGTYICIYTVQGVPKSESKVSSFHKNTDKTVLHYVLRVKTGVTFSSIFFLR